MENKEITPLDRFKQRLMREAERLTPEATFKFGCHPGVPCFNKCCSDVNIFLTPYDVVRLKNRLDIDSEEFLTRYTLMPMDENQNYPVVMLKMEEDGLTCPFLDGDKGCGVYEDRPWSCRMFPIGKASPKEKSAMPFYFFMKEEVCEGWAEEKEWSIAEWIEDQGVEPYDEMGELYKDVTLHDFFGKGGKLNPPQMEMFHMVFYNLDKFRLFVFNTSFLNRFDLEEERIEKMREDDEELLKFGFEWLRFSIFREPVLKIRDEEKERVEKLEAERKKDQDK